MATQTLELEDLIRLIGDLRLAGYDIGTQQYINAQRLLLALAAHGRHPERARDLRPLLGPVLCSSPREQENFYEYFPRWLARQPHLRQPGDDLPDRPDQPGPDPAGKKYLLERAGLWLRRHRLPLAAVAAVLLAGFAVYLLAPLWPRTLSGMVLSADQNNAPVPGARLTLARRRAAADASQPASDDAREATADDQGRFNFIYRTKDAPFRLTASAEGFVSRTRPLEADNLGTPLTITLNRPTTPPTPTPTQPDGHPPGGADAKATPTSPLKEEAPPPLYNIGGRVTEGDRGVGGVTITLTSRPSDSAESEPRVVSAAQTDASGGYTLGNLPRGADYTVTASHDDYTFEPQERAFAALGSDQTADFSATRRPALDFELLRLVALGLPLALFAAWWLWRLYRHRRMLLRKSRSAQPPRLEHLTVKGAAEQLFQGQAFRRTAQELRRHRQRVSHDLDERVTIEATVRRGGLFTPFYGSRKTLPEYLALIERVGQRDQQARFQEELVRRLVEDSVIVDQYYFRGDPLICRRKDEGAGRAAAYVRLPDLAALHPDYYLLVFSDGAGFIDPVTGEPEGWLEQFAHWPGRALLTPQPPAHWRAREWALQESEFLVLPVGREGLEALGEAINTGAPPDLARLGEGRSRPFPELLRERPRHWVEDHEPTPAKVALLMKQLRDYLGTDGMDWLAACAVYPALHWDLTLYLGFELVEDREEFECKLLALVSLPWLRYGVMPDWLRTRLVSTLAPEAMRTVRRALEILLVTFLDPPPDGVRLDYATRRRDPPPGGLKDFWLRLRDRFRRRNQRKTLRELFRTEEDDSPLKDFVFLTFMSGRRPRRLDFSVPDLLRHVIFPAGQRARGLRPSAALACAVILSFGGWVASSVLEPDTGLGRLNVDISWLRLAPLPTPEMTPPPTPPPSPTPGPTVEPTVERTRCEAINVSVGGDDTVVEGERIAFTAEPYYANFRWDIATDAGDSPDYVPGDQMDIMVVSTDGLAGRTLIVKVELDFSNTISDCVRTAETTARVLPKDDGGGDIGVAECDDYIAKYENCLNTGVPMSTRSMLRQNLYRTRDAWKQMGATAQGRAGLAQACRQALEQAKTVFAVYECDSGSNPSRHGAVREGIITIRRAKELLKERGFYDGPVDDADDGKFTEAVRKFQRYHAIPVDGILGSITAARLGAQPEPTPTTGPTPAPTQAPTPVALSHTSTDVDKVTILRLRGQIVGEENRQTLNSYFTQLRRDGRGKIVVDLGDVSEIDEQGVNLLVSVKRTISGLDGGDVKLLNVSKLLRDQLTIRKLLTVFDAYDNERQAVGSFQ